MTGKKSIPHPRRLSKMLPSCLKMPCELNQTARMKREVMVLCLVPYNVRPYLGLPNDQSMQQGYRCLIFPVWKRLVTGQFDRAKVGIARVAIDLN